MGDTLNHIDHLKALAVELEKTTSKRDAAVLEAAKADLAQMNDEDIQIVMNLVQPSQPNVTIHNVDNQFLRRAIGVAVAMVGAPALDRFTEIYQREKPAGVNSRILEDIVVLNIAWFFDVLWDWTKEKNSNAEYLLCNSAHPNIRAYAMARTLKTWEAATTTEDKLEAISWMYRTSSPEFLAPLTAAIEDPSLMNSALFAIERNFKIISEKRFAESNRDDLQRNARLARKILDIFKSTSDQKTKDSAKNTYFMLIIYGRDVDAVFTNAKQLLEKAETEESTRVLFIYVLGQLYKDRIRTDEQFTGIKKLVNEALSDSREAVKNEAQSAMKIIERRNNPPKVATPDWVNNM
jgi:hypothetical protein